MEVLTETGRMFLNPRHIVLLRDHGHSADCTAPCRIQSEIVLDIPDGSGGVSNVDSTDLYPVLIAMFNRAVHR